MSGRYYNFLKSKGDTLNYIFPDGDPNASEYASKDVASFYLLLNSLIPLALVVELELIKLFFTKVVEVDGEMTHEDFFIKDTRSCSV
jgi:hypothetical protein